MNYPCSLRFTLVSALLTSCFTYSTYSYANPTLPSIKKQQEDLIKDNQRQANENKLIDKLEVERGQAQTQMDNSIAFLLQGITITGNQILEQDVLKSLITPQINKNITSAGLKAIAADITRLLHERGYKTSQASVPAQQVKNGVVEIKIEEDKFAGIQVVGKNSFKYNDDLFFQYFADLKNKIIHLPTLEQRLKYLTFLPSVRIKPVLRKLKFGQSALVLVLEEQEDSSAVAINNNSGKYHGDLRATYSTLITNPTGRGDRFNLFLTINPEYPKYFSSVFSNYTIPYGPEGAKINVDFSQLEYQIEPEVLQQAASVWLYTGQSQQIQFSFEKPFLLDYGNNSWQVGFERRSSASQQSNLFADIFPIIHPSQVDVNGNPIVLGYEKREAGFKILDQEESIYSLNIGANFVFADNVFGQSYPGQNRVIVKLAKALEGLFGSLTQEDIDLKAINTQNAISPETGPIGDTREAIANFWKMYLSYSRQQLLPWNMLMNFDMSMEYANFDNIPSSFRFGGADTGTSGGEWSLSVNRSFALPKYVDVVNVELGYQQQIAVNTFIPSSPFDRDVQSCGGLDNLIAFETYDCTVSTPFINLQMRKQAHFLSLRYRAELESFETLDKKFTLSYSYMF